MAIIKYRADELVHLQGLAESKEKAKRLIMAGKIVIVDHNNNDQTIQVTKPGHSYTADTTFKLLEAERFVSRGGYKLLTLLEHCHLDVTDFVCIDAGASTGGFTDCLLQHNAKRVYAIDVGHNQLHEKLLKDPRVINLEGINVRTAKPELITEKVDLITADVSFISLTYILEPCMQWLKLDGQIAVLIKPQFELGPHETVKGVVKDIKDQQRAIAKIIDYAQEILHLKLQICVPSAIKGPKGNQEYMTLFSR